ENCFCFVVLKKKDLFSGIEFYLYGHKIKKRNLEDIVVISETYQLLDQIHPNPGVSVDQSKGINIEVPVIFLKTSPPYLILENTRYCALPSREERLSIDPLCGRVKCSY
ncbi:hypothetical protein Anas_03800, partial [Armadillidium nasatum]